MIDVLAGAVVEVATDRNHWVERPTRSAHASVVRSAARIPPAWRPFASCVLKRESGGTLEEPWSGAAARNPASSASGRWQFLDSSWRPGLAYMVAGRLKAHGMPKPAARTVRQWLADTPIHRWPAPFQDAGFVSVLLSNGWTHWNGPGCNGLRP